MKLRIHATEARSRANGPGARFVVWFQGCTLGCVGCFNPATHALGGEEVAVSDLLDRVKGVEGITLSGGEPFEQADAAIALLRGARARGLSTLVFSGFTIEELRARGVSLDALDVLIDGRYEARARLATGLRGSANQRIHLLSDRYTLAQVEATPVAEIRIAPDGSMVLTGVAPVPIRRKRSRRSTRARRRRG